MARGTATMVGLAVMIAVVLGVGTMALAAVPGNPFKLGQVNAINAASAISGNLNNAMLRVTNTSTGPSATALNLQVEEGKPPMRVDSTVEVQGLNVDQVDGLSASQFLQESSDRDDFLSSTIYVSEAPQEVQPNSGNTGIISCDAGDMAIGGGFDEVNLDASSVESSFLADFSGEKKWVVIVRNDSPSSVERYDASVVCADRPPLR